MPRRPIILFLGIVLVAVGAWAWGLVQSAREAPAVLSPVPIGGPFTLVDHSGNTVTAADFKGSYMLVFFGYTFCPDVCPTNILAISEAMDLLDERAELVQPLFITVDPERDTAEIMADYVGNFHPRLVGLTGTNAQVAAAAKAYRVYFSKFYPPPETLSGEQTSGDGTTAEDEGDSDYLMNHTATTFLMDPDGEFVAHFAHGTTPETMAAKIREHMPGS